LFGAASKPSFGASTNTGGSGGGGLFGASTGGGFGSTSNQSTALFNQPNSTALGGNIGECQGTGSTPFTAFTEKEGTSSIVNHFQSISFMAPYKNFSAEVSLGPVILSMILI
jgi:nuclear pore complex protein Nup98-Nup96